MSDSAMALMFNPDMFNQGQRLANVMAASQFLPPHLKGKTGPAETVANCYQVIVQAQRWEMDPYQVAAHTFAVGGRLGYDGQLIASVVHARSNLDGRLRCTYDGTGDARRITITGRFKDEDDPRTIEMTVAQGKAATQQVHRMWTSDPDQKLWYSGVLKWARRHCPEVVLGVRAEGEDFGEPEPIVVVQQPRTANARAAEVLGITPPPVEPTAATEAAPVGELAE
jgi:hypothetical protein